jgi:hypothetical protein
MTVKKPKNFLKDNYTFTAFTFRKETGMDTTTLAELIGKSRVWTSHLINGHLKDQDLTKTLPAVALLSGLDIKILAKYAYGKEKDFEYDMGDATISNLCIKIQELENKLKKVIGE